MRREVHVVVTCNVRLPLMLQLLGCSSQVLMQRESINIPLTRQDKQHRNNKTTIPRPKAAAAAAAATPTTTKNDDDDAETTTCTQRQEQQHPRHHLQQQRASNSIARENNTQHNYSNNGGVWCLKSGVTHLSSLGSPSAVRPYPGYSTPMT